MKLITDRRVNPSLNKKNQVKKKKQRGSSTKNTNVEGHKFTWKYEIQIDDIDFQVGK